MALKVNNQDLLFIEQTEELRMKRMADLRKQRVIIATRKMLRKLYPDKEIGAHLLARVMKDVIPPPKGQPWSDLSGQKLVATSNLVCASCFISPLHVEDFIAEGGLQVLHVRYQFKLIVVFFDVCHSFCFLIATVHLLCFFLLIGYLGRLSCSRRWFHHSKKQPRAHCFKLADKEFQ